MLGSGPFQVTYHTFRATGITTYLENGGELETTQHIAVCASANMTRIYDHRDQKVEQEEIERVRI
jgi:integrase/recombinase XerD